MVKGWVYDTGIGEKGLKIYIVDVQVATVNGIIYTIFRIFDWYEAAHEGSISNIYIDDLTIDNPK